MQTDSSNLALTQNPGILAEADQKKILIKDLEKLIHDAVFISKENEENWIRLLPYFSEEFLIELKGTVIRESLRHLSKKHLTKN